MKRARALIQWVVVVALAMSAAGCSKSLMQQTFTIRPVPASDFAYAPSSQPAPASFTLADARPVAEKPLNAGRFDVQLVGMENEIEYLGDNVARVLKDDGIQVAYDPHGEAPVKLEVLKFRIRNMRSSGFSPYHTFTFFSADLTSGGPRRRITSFFKNSKTPFSSFDEVERPCYQVPVEVTVKEVAAKLNAQVFHRVASDETVEHIVASIPTAEAGGGSEQYLKVLQLGFTNNPAAIAPLVALTRREETLMRAAAISALGILGAKEQYPLLRQTYESSPDDSIVKLMAIKAIGDLDTPEGNAYLRAVMQSEQYRDDEMLREVVALYL